MSADVTFTLEPVSPLVDLLYTTVTVTQRSHVENGLTAVALAQYTHTLTLQYNCALIETRQLQGIYIRSVVNAVSSANSPHLYIHGI